MDMGTDWFPTDRNRNLLRTAIERLRSPHHLESKKVGYPIPLDLVEQLAARYPISRLRLRRERSVYMIELSSAWETASKYMLGHGECDVYAGDGGNGFRHGRQHYA